MRNGKHHEEHEAVSIARTYLADDCRDPRFILGSRSAHSFAAPATTAAFRTPAGIHRLPLAGAVGARPAGTTRKK